MKESFYLAFRYLRYHRSRTLILVTCITLISFLPNALSILLNKSEEILSQRASSTALIMGSKGSNLDLVMNTLYFQKDLPEPIKMSSLEEVLGTGHAGAIPMYVRFQARNFPVVGTSIDYFDYRGLKPESGRVFSRLGECVIGAAISETLGLKEGDHIVTSPENVFDLAGVYPLKMQVTGVLKETGNSDDQAIFTDVKTTWVIEGLVHGHEDLSESTDQTIVIDRDSTRVQASAKLYQYNEVTDSNIDSFHFHGSTQDYPLTSLIVVPFSEKSSTLLQGEYIVNETTGKQLVVPDKVITEMLENVFKIKTILDGVILFMGVATLLALILVFSLSMKLRQREMTTVFKMGSSRNLISRLFLAEILIIAGLSALFNFALLGITRYLANHYEQFILVFI